MAAERKSLESVAPPLSAMPWFNVKQWSDTDLRAFYAYVRQLGPVGEAAPQPLPPNQEPKPPVVTFPAPPPK